MRILFAFIILCQPLAAMHRPATEQPLGVHTFQFHDDQRDRPVVVEFWYPADRSGPVEAAVLDSIWIHPDEVRNAGLRKSAAKYPLILMSHGYRGGRRDLSWLAERFAKAGYVIASVDHFGDMRTRFDQLASIRFWERSRDFIFVLDRLRQEPRVRDQIDFNRIGFIGYSLGGMTGLALAGAQAQNVHQVFSQLNNTIRHVPPELIDRFDFSEAEKSYAEPRIRAMLLLCPATYVYPSSSFTQVKIPVGLVATIEDEVLPFQDHASRLIQHLIPAKLKVLRGEISHYAFMNRVTAVGKKTLSKAAHRDPPGCDRSFIHREIGTFAIDFFKEVLNSL